jgi:glutamate dehydrogenase
MTLAPNEHLLQAVQNESRKFQEFYLWLERAMPKPFFEEVSQEEVMLVAHHLMGFELQDRFCLIDLKGSAIVLTVEGPDADLKILEKFSRFGIKNYQAFVSKESLPGIKDRIRVGIVFFTQALEEKNDTASLPENLIHEMRLHIKESNPEVSDHDFQELMEALNGRFVRSIALEDVTLAADMFFRAKNRDNCQYVARYQEDWKESGKPSMQLVMAWRSAPKYNFLYRLARVIHRHGLVMRRVNATYIRPYERQNILVMVIGIHGGDGRAAWEAADLSDFLRELARVKYFAGFDQVENMLVNPGIITGNFGNLLRGLTPLIHQFLLPLDANLFTQEAILETFCAHPDLTQLLVEAFKARFRPDHVDLARFEVIGEESRREVGRLDTGNEVLDRMRKMVLTFAFEVIAKTLKNNFYRNNLTALSFRLDPAILDCLPYDRTKLFPELPFGIFYMKGMHFFGFHVRFKDLARGGVRTVYLQNPDQVRAEQNFVFSECYNLALTQHKKNKEIPEGGAKGVIFLQPFVRLDSEAEILKRELDYTPLSEQEKNDKVAHFREEQRNEFLHSAQRSYIESFLTLINCEDDGKIRAKHIVDYWKKPEYIYIGPDENMSNEIISWIAMMSKKYGYRPGGSFITSKPAAGINHKAYGVTSLGVIRYMDHLLRTIGIDPKNDIFRVKLSGGPDGDVAGNALIRLAKDYPKTARVVALTDISGTISDPEGLSLPHLKELFLAEQSIRFYPPEKLNDGGFLLDKQTKRAAGPYAQQTLLWRKRNRKVEEEWLSGSETNYLLRHNLHSASADIFITAGGRPKTLNEHNWKDFLLDDLQPSSKIIVEGANLYLTPEARRKLEELGVYIIKDSSANKTGVICSSFEVLAGLTLGDELFIQQKEVLVQEILARLQEAADKEALLILREHQKTGLYMTDISNRISDQMNRFKYEILEYLHTISLGKDLASPWHQLFLSYCLPTLSRHFEDRLMAEIPEGHKKAIIAALLASETIYRRGIAWSPSIVDILPLVTSEILTHK